MPPGDVDLHPEARAELLVAIDWYLAHSPKAAENFADAVEHALREIAQAPERWPRHPFGTRRYVLPRFPYSVIYRVPGPVVHVYAVAHAKRKPGYWRARKFR